MSDIATPNLPSRDLGATVDFYARLGFDVAFRDEGWLILTRRGLTVEFFPMPALVPTQSAFSCCLRLDDVDGFHRVCRDAGVPEGRTGFPRVHAPADEPSGMRIGALVDPDGNLLRLVGGPRP